MVSLSMIYDCDINSIKKQDVKTMDAFEMWCWRKVLETAWTDIRTNKSIFNEVNPDHSLQAKLLNFNPPTSDISQDYQTHCKSL